MTSTATTATPAASNTSMLAIAAPVESGATCTTYCDALGGDVILGQVYELATGTGPLYVVQGHDWDGPNYTYDPILLGAFTDPAEAETAIRNNTPAQYL